MSLSADVANLQATAAAYRTLSAQIVRAGVTLPGTYSCRVVPSQAFFQPVPGSVLLRVPTWEVILPAGTDVREADVLSVSWPGPVVRTYGVTSVLDPRSFEVERICTAYLLSDGALPGGGVDIYLPTNATVNVKRGTASAHYTNHAVYLEYPTRQEQIMAGGAEVPVLLADLPDANYQNGDTVTIVSVAGHTVVPHPAALRVGLVERLSGPPPLTGVQLTGLAGYA